MVGANRPGTYLVGLRRLTGAAQRAYMRVQITNLSITSVEETGRAVLYVRALDSGDAVRGATVKLEGLAGTPQRPVEQHADHRRRRPRGGGAAGLGLDQPRVGELG